MSTPFNTNFAAEVAIELAPSYPSRLKVGFSGHGQIASKFMNSCAGIRRLPPANAQPTHQRARQMRRMV
jgi:hypothetical protein